MLSVGSMIYIVLVLIFEFPSYYERYLSQPTAVVNYFTFNFKFFNAVGVIYFAYTNQSQLFPIYKELVNPTKARVTKVISRAGMIVGFFYISVPTFGYLSTLQFTPTVIVNRPMLDGKDYF